MSAGWHRPASSGAGPDRRGQDHHRHPCAAIAGRLMIQGRKSTNKLLDGSERGGGMRVAVIGGGLGGLAAACVLRGARPQVTLFDKNPGSAARRRVLDEGGLPLRHGPDDPDRAARAASASSPRPGATWPTTSISSGSTRNGAASSTTARASTCQENVDAMAASMDALRARHAGRRGLPALPGPVASTCTTSRSGSSSGSRSRTCSTPSTSAPTSTPATLRDVLSLRMGTLGRRHHPRPR